MRNRTPQIVIRRIWTIRTTRRRIEHGGKLSSGGNGGRIQPSLPVTPPSAGLPRDRRTGPGRSEAQVVWPEVIDKKNVRGFREGSQRVIRAQEHAPFPPHGMGRGPSQELQRQYRQEPCLVFALFSSTPQQRRHLWSRCCLHRTHTTRCD